MNGTEILEHGLDASDGENQFLTFLLQEEEFGIEVLRVQEIKGLSRITPIPNMPTHIRGVMNLRGTVIPILDLREKFLMPAKEYDQFTVIVVVTVCDKIVGLVVDAVSDVLDVADGDIEPTPQLGFDSDVEFLQGIAKSGERLITLLNMEQLIDTHVADSQMGVVPA
ncbi:MAG: chemotaxis protein CheW [Planctomycetota bacterium]